MSATRSALVGIVLLAAAPAAAAPTGWTAVQRSRSPGSQLEQKAEVTYGHHRLRVDHPGQRLIIDFRTGALVYVDTVEKRYARVTLEEMVALREKQLTEVKARLDQVPPAIRKQMEAQIAEAEKSARRRLDARPTENEETIDGVECTVYTWSSSDGEGRACVATKLPFDPKAFQKDSSRLSRKMQKLGAGSAASSMAILQLGEHGLPIRIDQTLRLGAGDVQVVSTFESIEAKRHPKSFFEPPSGFARLDFETMMTEAIQRAPRLPPN